MSEEQAKADANARRIPPQYDKRGRPYWTARMSAPDATFGMCLMVPDRVIPVIFVPGVMGSNLIQQGVAPGDAVKWRLDNPLTAVSWAPFGAEYRKRYLRPDVMEVDRGGSVPEDMSVPAEELRRRGWGEIGALSYSEALRWLETALNDFDDPASGERVGLVSRDLQALVGEVKLSREEVALSYRYRFPVWACGYNWLASNSISAQRLSRRIDEIKRRYAAEKLMCEKVIIVTHSMGGLVARYCSEVLGRRDDILGIVHGVMPAVGAAAVYRRFKAGTEDPTAWWNAKGAIGAAVLGNDAADMTAVLSTAPGPLQLLPTPEYGNGWLKIKDGAQEHVFPKNGDPYGEIYTVRGKWWSMCDDQLMNPLNKAGSPSQRKPRTDADWLKFAEVIKEDVKRFHDGIKAKYHPNTYAFFGSHVDYRSYGTVIWNGSRDFSGATVFKDRKVDTLDALPISSEELKERRLKSPELQAVRHTKASYSDRGWLPETERTFTLAEPDELGDGTVPHRSGVAPQPFAKGFLQVRLGHEPAYKLSEGADNLRACRFTLRSIVKIAQGVVRTSLRYE